MTPQEAQQYLDSFINHEIHLGQTKSSSFKPQRVKEILGHLGNPQDHLKIIHVAGSKGKGSICALTASILKEAGYKVGLYTSPHINHFRERIRVLVPTLPNRKPTYAVGAGSDIFSDMISEEELRIALDDIQPAVEKVRAQKELGNLSFFEVTTSLALHYFHKQQVDFVVLETGLGGRLDATNVAPSLVAVIAPISLEHTNILGDTITQIAREKAAIIKSRGQKVVIAPQESPAREVLKDRCRGFNIEPLWVEEHVKCEAITQDIDGQMINVHCSGEVYPNLKLSLLGKHQRDNAAAAVSIMECLKKLDVKVPTDAIQKGFAHIFWPGRFEVVQKEPLVILDGAHNRASAKVLVETMRTTFGEKKVILILGVSEDKDKESICEVLNDITKDIIYTKADHPRASDLPGAVDVSQALTLAHQKAVQEDIILVTGSMFVMSEARAILESCYVSV